MMRQLLDLLDDRERVVIVNDNVPRSWNQANNDAIDAAVADYPNAVIADWKSASRSHPEYFVSDGIHLSGAGARAYADLIKDTARVRAESSEAATSAQ
jgi:lysophospholipase L1-like esterase